MEAGARGGGLVLRWAITESHPKGLQQEDPWSGSGDLASSSISVTYMLDDRSLALSFLSDTHSGINAPITSNSFLCVGWAQCL